MIFFFIFFDKEFQTGRLLKPFHFIWLSMSINNGKGAVSALRQRVTGAAPEPGSIIQLRKTVLAGGFCALPSNLLWRSPQWKLVVYLSSSHSDCKIERDLLINNLLPHIRKNGIENGISVEIVDLKWGIRSETECIEETWEYRKREIKRCREESVGLFFITLQSNR